LVRLYRSRLPSPEDIVDPGHRRDDNRVRSRDDRGPHAARTDDGRGPNAGQRTGFRRSMEGGSVWFRANVGRRKNAEARWLLPMICRRGGINKNDIGAIRIYQAITEFEISAKAAEKFAAKVQDPDKDDIHIEALPDGPRGEAPADASVENGDARGNDKPRYDKPRKHHDERFRERMRKPGKKPGFDKKQRPDHKPAYAGQSQRRDAASFAKPAFGKK